MITRTCQSGYALLLMLLVMVSGSAWWLSVATGSIHAVSSHRQYLQADQWAMIQARQSLLSYTSLYPYMYGPSGAGPGHLPCPDTDSQSSVSSQRPFAGDSPNPPCGSSHSSSGHLPRHVSLPGNRYAFHSEPYQHFNYTVYAHVVNNPVNRAVNPSLVVTEQSKHAVAAIIELANHATTAAQEVRSTVRITNAALLEVVKPAVAAWIEDAVEQSGVGLCRTLTISGFNSAQYVSSEQTQRCRRLGELQAICVDDSDEIGHAKADAILLLLVDQLPQVDTCVSADSRESTIERVAAGRHWFIRNQWPEWVQIESTPECIAGLIECSLIYQVDDSTQRPKPQSQKLLFQWQPLT